MDIELNGVWCTGIVAVVVAGILSTVEERMDFLSNHPEVSDEAPIMGTVVIENGMIEVPTIDATGLELMCSLTT